MPKPLPFLLAILALVTSARATPPNILFIFSDDQGTHDVSCYGSEIPTPNIDRIAAEGIQFNNFYSASSICTPSRFGLLTGRNPVRSHDQLLGALMFMAEEHADKGIRSDETTIASLLREKAGYDTALIGKWHLGHGSPTLKPLDHGFNTFIGHTGGCIDYFTMCYGIIPDWYHGSELVTENGYATELITDEAIHYLADQKKQERPFFLYLAYNAPHFGKGYSPADEKPVNLMQPQAADLKRVAFIDDTIRREFAAMTVNLDDGIGKVLDALKEHGLEDNTIVVFMTDHGGDPTYGGSNIPLRGKKATLFEGGIRVPCIVRWPGKIEPGQQNDDLIWSLDFFPTFCDLAGIELGESLPLDGSSFAPLLQGEQQDLPESRKMLWMTGAHAELERKSWLAYRDGDLKYLNSPQEGEFLFNLKEDPNEQENLSSDRPEDFRRLKTEAHQLVKTYRPETK